MACRGAIAIPRAVLEHLAAAPLSASDVRYYEGLTRRKRSVLATPAFYWDDFWMRLGRGRGLPRALPCLPTYLAFRLGVPPAKLPGTIARRVLRQGRS